MGRYEGILYDFETVLALNISQLIFAPCEDLASHKFTVSRAKEAADYLLSTLQNLRTEEVSDREW